MTRTAKRMGRRPKGEISGKASAFTTRITPDMRDALDRMAALHGRSVSQEAEILLGRGIGAPDGLEETALGPEHVRMLAVAFAMVVQRIEQRTGASWTADRYTFETLVPALSTLLEKFKPAGKAKVPQRIRDYDREMNEPGKHKDPGSVGFREAAHFVFQLEARQLPPAWTAGRDAAKEFDNESYLLPKIRDALSPTKSRRGGTQ